MNKFHKISLMKSNTYVPLKPFKDPEFIRGYSFCTKMTSQLDFHSIESKENKTKQNFHFRSICFKNIINKQWLEGVFGIFMFD